jgi:multidrug efflux pump
MLNAKLMRSGHKKSRFYNWTEPFFVGMVEGYGRSLNRFLTKKWIALPIILFCFGMIWFFGKNLQSELAPLDDRSALQLQVTAPEGASFEYTDFFILKLTKLLNDSIPEKKIGLTVTSPGFTGSGAANTGFVRMRISEPQDRTRSQADIANALTRMTKRMPEAKTFVIQQQTISSGGRRGGLPVQYVLQAPNFEKLREYLPKFIEKASQDPTFTMVDVDLKFNKPELSVTIDREKAKSLGVSIVDIAQTLQLALSGQRFSYFTMNGKQYAVVGQFDRANRDEPLDLTSIFVRNTKGDLIQLDNVVNITEQSSPPQLYHNNRFMSATVSAALAPGKTIGDGIKVMDRVKAEVLDDTFSTALAGSSRDFAESSSNILFAFLLSLILIYLILSAQFESFIDPFIIMITVPLAIAGALLSLWIFGQTLNIFSQIGIIMLIGLVTKNGILIVEFANQLKLTGMTKAQAIRDASAARLRPILMTSLAIALGALPIALSLGAASKSRVGMGIVIVGGTIFSLILTLYVVPAVYSLLSRTKTLDTNDYNALEK